MRHVTEQNMLLLDILHYVIERIGNYRHLFWFLDWYIFAMLSWYVFAYLPWNFFGNFDGYLMAIGFGHFDTMFLGNLFGHIMANFFGNLETIKIIYQGVLSNGQVGLNL